MRKKQEKMNYSAPSCMIIQVNETTDLMIETSFPSQHKKAGHKTGPTPIGGAKAATIWQDEEEVDNAEDTSPWED